MLWRGNVAADGTVLCGAWIAAADVGTREPARESADVGRHDEKQEARVTKCTVSTRSFNGRRG